MQKPIATFLFVWVLVLGCHHDDPEHPATTHLRNYLRLKKKSPDSALVELIQHAKIAFQEHPKAAEWAQLVARLDGAGRASLPDRLRLRRLELEMARENDVPAEYFDRRIILLSGTKYMFKCAIEAGGNKTDFVVVQGSCAFQ